MSKIAGDDLNADEMDTISDGVQGQRRYQTIAQPTEYSTYLQLTKGFPDSKLYIQTLGLKTVLLLVTMVVQAVVL